MDWRTWVFDRLRTDPTITADVPEINIHGPGGLTGATDSPGIPPFIAIRFGSESGEINDGDVPVVSSQRMTVYVHDVPGDYLRIQRILANTRHRLAGAVSGVGGIMAIWEGDGPDLADDIYKTITKYGEYRLVGKVA